MLKVAEKCCGQCLFSKNKIVSDECKADILNSCRRDDTHFNCHKGTILGEEIVCRGFFEKEDSNMIRIASRLRMIDFVEVDNLSN